MTKHIKIDFISDVTCPWCAIGLAGLKRALQNSADVIDAEIVFHPYELNPTMPSGGQNIVEHVAEKYGATRAQSDANRSVLVARAADAGFDMAIDENSRIYNSFDAHRLLHWAKLQGRQMQLKNALFIANFTNNRDLGDHAVLVQAAATAGLDVSEARMVLESDQYAAEVRSEVDHWKSRGIHSVPSIILDGRQLISGGLPVKEFEEILRTFATET